MCHFSSLIPDERSEDRGVGARFIAPTGVGHTVIRPEMWPYPTFVGAINLAPTALLLLYLTAGHVCLSSVQGWSFYRSSFGSLNCTGYSRTATTVFSGLYRRSMTLPLHPR